MSAYSRKVDNNRKGRREKKKIRKRVRRDTKTIHPKDYLKFGLGIVKANGS